MQTGSLLHQALHLLASPAQCLKLRGYRQRLFYSSDQCWPLNMSNRVVPQPQLMSTRCEDWSTCLLLATI
ncbi:hypothetical protein EMIT053CA3_40112 [Pseudomonas donghuensis]